MKLSKEQLILLGKNLLVERYIGYVGLAGLICLALSGATWLVQMRFGALAAFFAIVGFIGVLIYLVGDFKHILAQFSKRSVKYGTNVTIMIFVVLGIAIFVEAISSQHSVRFDLTRNKRFTLSEQTKKILNTLEKDVNIMAFFSLDQGDREAANDLLQQYKRLSAHISYEFIDPDKNPGRAKSYDIKTYGTIVLETKAKHEKITELTEENLTNALVKVIRDEQKVVYFLKGHGERSLDDVGEHGYSQVKQAIEKENYVVKDLLLMQQQAVPEDATLLIIAGLQKDLVPAEEESLKAYINKGGNVLFLLDPDQSPGMTPFLKTYGVIVGDDMIIDTFSRVFGGGYEMPVASAYTQHPITENFNIATFYPVARSIRLEEQLPQGISGTVLATSSPQSWAETNKQELQGGAVEFNEGLDLQGPVPLAVVITRDLSQNAEQPDAPENPTEASQSQQGRLVVFGDSDFASNTYLGLSGNSDLFLNTVSWMAEEKDLIAIRAKDPETAPLILTAGQGRFAFFLSVVFLPLLVIGTGMMVYMNRKKSTQ
ncbi:putative ABC-type uncharacterized transport system involved in gliding motility auxiliary [Candidatus Vecturithrix granuli]|uniref:Putative ABC-type uncharacterized transport system involved in gliding motility auxiliary n=1 Tax=Vecturithrix granuli TaxID=1499967 RepID=A0A081C166_VECG1|nr:putative ABC-type uncharacterized transport system involved in gliding motility auxiliary [Candidatus Vecturithrix granuli]